MTYILIYLALGLIVGKKIADKTYNQFKEKHNPSNYEPKLIFIAKHIDSVIWGLAFIIGTLLWPLGLLELIGDRK